MATYPDFANAHRYGGAGVRQQLQQGANSVSGMQFADAQQLGFLPWERAPGIGDFRVTRGGGGGDSGNSYTTGVFTGDLSSGGSNSAAIDPEALAAYLEQQGYKIGHWEGGPGQNWRWLEDAQGNYVPGFEPQNYFTDDRTAAMLGMLALGGAGAAAIGAGVGMGASAGAGVLPAGATGTSAFGGALPTFGAGLGEGVIGGVDLLGSSLLTGSAGIGEVGGALATGATGLDSATRAFLNSNAGYGAGMSGAQTGVFDTILNTTGSTAAAKIASDLAGGASWVADAAKTAYDTYKGVTGGGSDPAPFFSGSPTWRDLLTLFGAGMQQWNIEKVAKDQREWIDSKEAATRRRRAPVRGTAGVLRVIGG